MTAVLVLGQYRQTINVMRSLNRAGYRTILGHCGERGPASRSRYARDTWHHPPLADDSAARFGRALRDFLVSTPDVRCLFPVGGEEIQFLTRHRELLPDSIACAMPDEKTVNVCFDKAATFETLLDLGIPHAAWQLAENDTELLSVVESVGFPCIVKSDVEGIELFGRKALVLRSPEELSAALRDWPSVEARWIVQRYVTGHRHNVYFFAEEGRLRSRVEVKIERTDRADGTGLAVEGISVAPSPGLADDTARLIERLNYTGAGCAQFLVDEKRELRSFLETNPRLGANFAIAQHCGLDLARWWIEKALGKQPEIPATRPEVGQRYCWLYGDIQGFKHALRRRDASVGTLLRWPLQMIRACLRADIHITWDRHDPMPALSNLAETVFRPASRVVTGKSRSDSPPESPVVPQRDSNETVDAHEKRVAV